MARTDISQQVARIIALGGTEAQVLAAGPRVTRFSATDWAADNAATRCGIDALEDRLSRAAAKKTSAAEIVEKIRSGLVLYTKTADGQWLVWGREDVITVGATVTALRRDGTTQTVVITAVGPVLERAGLHYRTAEFRAARSVEVDPMDEIGLTGEAAEALRIGRSYGVDGQVWDNA